MRIIQTPPTCSEVGTEMPAPQQLARQTTAKPAGKAGPSGRKGQQAGQSGALQAKLQKANYREGRDLVKPGQGNQPSVMSAGPKPQPGGKNPLNSATRGVEQTDQAAADGDPIHSKLFNELAKGRAEGKAQFDKADNMHAGTQTEVNTPASMGKGSMTLATGAAVGSTVNDAWSMSTQYRAEQQLAPGDSREELLARAVTMDPARGGTMLTTKHGETASDAKPAQDSRYEHKQDRSVSPLQNVPDALRPKRKAIVVGNSDYIDKDPPAGVVTLFNDLPGAKADAAAMAADLDRRGFDVEQHENLDAAEMRKAILGRGQGLKEGDELAIVYTGHGIDWGLNGVDSAISTKTHNVTDVLPHTDIAAEASKAVGGGYHLEMIVDACESDGLAREVRKNLEGGGAASLSRSTKDNGYKRLASGERVDALQNVLQGKGYNPSSLDAMASMLEDNTELQNR